MRISACPRLPDGNCVFISGVRIVARANFTDADCVWPSRETMGIELKAREGFGAAATRWYKVVSLSDTRGQSRAGGSPPAFSFSGEVSSEGALGFVDESGNLGEDARYYDDGQGVVTDALHAAFEYALNKQAIIHRDCSPADFRFRQIADFICEIELATIKYEANDAGGTERIFFGSNRDFKKNYLRKLRKKRLE